MQDVVMTDGGIVRNDEEASKMQAKIIKVIFEHRLSSPVYLSAENSIIAGVVDTDEAPPPRK